MTFWADEETALLDPDRDHVIRDSKTPSGTVPVSGLRGPIVTDALYRTFRQRGIRIRYVFTIDDYDPVDSQSMRTNPVMAPYMGMPLFRVPSPDPSYSDYAKYHGGRYLATFASLGIRPEEVRWLRDLYQSGDLDPQIDLVLRNAAVIRRVYAEVANVQKDDRWLPIAMICDNCGRIGSTYAHDYQPNDHQLIEGTVAYSCRPDYVTWAQGCGYEGRSSPFRGRAKLYWNLQWCAMWDHFRVTYEEGGKDLLTAGGSRDRADEIYRAVWRKDPPVGLMHEFLNIGGRKISTSRPEEWQQLGIAAHDLVGIYPPEIIRFLMLRTEPKRHIDFDPTGMSLPKLMDEYDRCADEYLADQGSDLAKVWALSQIDPNPAPPGFRVRFEVVATWIQTPKVNTLSLATSRKGEFLNDDEQIDLIKRERLAHEWLKRWAPDEMRMAVPHRAEDVVLDLKARAFLVEVKERVTGTTDPEQMESYLYDAARRTGLSSRVAFKTIYLVLLGKPVGPRAARLLTGLPKEDVLRQIDAAIHAS